MPCRIAYTGPEPPPMQPPGARVYWVPLVSVEPVRGASVELLREAPSGGGALLVVTSPRAPRLLALDALEHGVYEAVRGLVESSAVAAVGPSTLGEAERLLGRPGEAVVPEYWSVEALAEALEASGRRYPKAIVLRAARPSPSYPRLLEALRAVAGGLAEVLVYRNPVLRGNAELLAGAVEAGLVDVVALSSPSQARALAEALGGGRPRARIAVIGRATRRALEALGLKAEAEPPRPGLGALLEAAARLCEA